MAFLLSFLTFPHPWSIKGPEIQTPTRLLFWDMSLPSSWSACFPDKIVFPASATRLLDSLDSCVMSIVSLDLVTSDFLLWQNTVSHFNKQLPQPYSYLLLAHSPLRSLTGPLFNSWLLGDVAKRYLLLMAGNIHRLLLSSTHSPRNLSLFIHIVVGLLLQKLFGIFLAQRSIYHIKVSEYVSHSVSYSYRKSKDTRGKKILFLNQKCIFCKLWATWIIVIPQGEPGKDYYYCVKLRSNFKYENFILYYWSKTIIEVCCKLKKNAELGGFELSFTWARMRTIVQETVISDVLKVSVYSG